MTAEPQERGISRVTIDIDSYCPGWRMKAVKAYYNARNAGAVELDVRVSSSGKGIHIVAWFPKLLTDERKTTLRETLGDDPNRMRMDAVRGGVGHTTQVLWSEKRGETAEKHYEDVWHALETIEERIKSQNPESVPHGFANHGRKAVGRLAFPTRTPKTPHPNP